MPDYSGGSVLLSVKPVFRNLQQQVAREYEQAGKDARKAFERGMGSGPAPTPAPSPTDSRRRGAEAGGAFADGFRRQIEAALRSLPPARIGVATSAAEAELRDLRTDLESLSGKTVGVDISSAEALAEVERISTRLRELGAQSPDVQVRADTAGALAALEAIAAAARRVDGQDVDIDVNVDTSAAEANLNSFTGRLIALSTIIGGLGPALIPIGAVGAGALTGIGTGAVAAGAGLGALLLGVSGVGDAVKALGKAQETQGKTAASNAAAATAAASQIANAQRAVESAEASLANTRANAAAATEASTKRIADAQADLARAQEDAARSVTDAQQRVADVAEDSARRIESARTTLADAETRGAEQIQAALERQERAERDLADAQDSARVAQEDLTEARKTAAERLQDLSFDVTNAALRQRQAVLDVAEAQATLAKVTRDPTANKNDIGQAQLRYEQALQSLEEIGVRLGRLREDKAAADAAGVEGSQGVLDAQKRIQDSARDTADAQKAIGAAIGDTTKAVTGSARDVGDAQAALSRAQQQATRDQSDAAAALVLAQEGASRKVIDAQDAVVEATKAAAEQQRQSAFSVEQAQRSLIGAQESLASASEATGSTSSAALDNLATAMANLSPAGQAFALFLFSLQPAIDSIRAAAAQDLLPGLTTAIQTLLPALPSFNSFLVTMGGVMGDLAIQAAQALTGPGWAPFFNLIARTGGPTLELFAQAGGNLVLALANLLVAFEPLSTAFAQGFADMMARFAEFTANLGSNEGFQSFLDYLVSSGPLVKDFFGALFDALGNIIVAMAPFGQTILGIVTGLLNFIAAIPPAVLQAIVLAVVGIVAAFNVLGPIIAFVGGIIGAVTAGVPVLGAVLAALGGPVTLIIAGVIALGAALVAAYQHSETFRDIVDGVFSAIGKAGVFLWENALKPAFEGIGAVIDFVWKNVLVPIFEAYKFYFEKVLGPVALFLWHNVIEPAWAGIRIAIDVAWALIQVILGAFELYIRLVLAPLFTWLWQNVIKPAWEGISTLIANAWNNVIKPVLDLLGNYIKDNVAPSFSRGVDAIAKAWEGIKEAAKAPVRFVVERVINDGIIDAFNNVAAQFPGIDKVARIKLPEGFARGGVLPGASSWRDGDDQLVPMRRGEGVAISEAMAVPALRAELLRWNAIGVRGGRSALASYAGGGGFAKGGIIGSLANLASSAGAGATRVLGSIGDILTDPKAAISALVKRLLELVPGAGTALGSIASAVPTKLLAGMGDVLAGMGQAAGEGVGAALAPLSGSAGPTAAGLVALGRQLQAQGFRVGEHPLFGGVNPVHTKNSDHYKGRAIDVNYGPGGENNIEKRAIDGIVDSIRAAGFKVLWRSAGHFDHLHAAYDNGGYLQPGYTQVFNGTGKPEPVFTADQWDVLKGAALGTGGQMGLPDVVTLVDRDGTFIARMRTEAGGVVAQVATDNQNRARQGVGKAVMV